MPNILTSLVEKRVHRLALSIQQSQIVARLGRRVHRSSFDVAIDKAGTVRLDVSRPDDIVPITRWILPMVTRCSRLSLEDQLMSRAPTDKPAGQKEGLLTRCEIAIATFSPFLEDLVFFADDELDVELVEDLGVPVHDEAVDHCKVLRQNATSHHKHLRAYN